ncbi:filamentous hemagglutinin N-terminal domain-containing protein [Kamptonema sp. UHCC 0994]|uniref:two-partner secretion domain-containing protein n=1 Tax=Kamptonema sp. UHCC 0994 TaxID=3031329 RepID=UPI0023B9ABE1|nr:filamentous hemagglutinin N-terminal domain-containing protein [Kamptonema sp. UHCC 0994]MDF0555497.1 filamentous hemagglutinin N-terminal domain-containing protein [Kamptonema sp. UHCC 0994]
MPRKSSALIFAFLLLFPFPALAQIVPDNSLGAESSRTVPATINNLPSDRIEGGATRGPNLFHSFREFNVGEGRGAYFANPNGILNIFTRVTGGNPSNILGTLGVQGNANLFLLNPKGIVFGPNARLDLRGSFIGSTASGIFFDNGFEFSAANSNGVPLLAINIPVGLNFRENPGTIVNTSQAIGPTPTLPPLPIEIPLSNKLGLAVDPGQTLALIGGDIQLQGGNLTAYTGQILLGSVKSPGLVQFEPTALGLNLNYDNIQNFGNIEINSSLINTSGLGGGKIDIRGGNVTLNGSGIYGLTLGNIDGRGIDITAQNLRTEGGQIATYTLGDGVGGSVNIRATDLVEMTGIGFESYQQLIGRFIITGTINTFDPQLFLTTGTIGNGASGAIAIDTGRLVLKNGIVIGAATFGAGNGGNITLRARVFEMASSAINSGTLQGSTGTGGNITFEGERLIVRDGAAIVSVTRSNAASGNINIKANESVEILRTPDGNSVPTLIGTTAVGLNGGAGNINIDTKRLTITDGSGISSGSGLVLGDKVINTTGGPGGNLIINATESIEMTGISGVLATGSRLGSFLSADTYSSSQGGNIRISTPMLTLRNGIISTASFGQGDAGNITIDANRVEIIGTMNPGGFNSLIRASIGFAGDLTNPNATANAGSLNLNINQLILRNGAAVSVQALGMASAGNINLVTDSISLNNQAIINGTTEAGGGGNVNIRAEDIQLRRGSRITTDAGTSDGGNIRINSDILATLPNENNDITANARTARGGQVTVNVPNIFGFSAVTREQARSSLGLNDAEFAALQVNPTSLLPTSDIAAISQQAGPALQGAVTFSATGVNPAQGLIALPQNVVDPTTLIAANPCLEGSENEFTVTGKGGVPPNPNDVLNSDYSQFNWVEPAIGGSQQLEGRRQDTEGRKAAENRGAEVIPARGWVMNNAGEVTLVAYNSGNTAAERNSQLNAGCVRR